METSTKRKAADLRDDSGANKEKKKRQWQTPGRRGAAQGNAIEAGDAGIWATCQRDKEAKSVGELRDLLQEYAEKLYGDDPSLKEGNSNGDNDADGDADDIDLEAEIQDELKDMRKSKGASLFKNVRIDVQCVLFFKTLRPVDPVNLVHEICRDALQTGKKRTRFLNRLTPITKMGRASEAGLEELAKEVLAPYFHTGDGVSRTFAIRPTTRNHDKTLTRETVIQRVASIVGAPHKVDLNKPDLTIIVEIYKFHCGMSVVGPEFDELKRFNLAELYGPGLANLRAERGEGKDTTDVKAFDSPLPGAAQA